MRTLLRSLVLSLLVVAPLRASSKPATPANPLQPRPAEQMKALEPFLKNATMKTRLSAGALSPESPEVPAHGKQTCRPLWGGFAYSCDIENTIASKKPMTWRGHMMVGWDGAAQTYQLLMVSNLGGTMPMRGKIDGQKFIMETPNEVTEMGQTFKDRITLDIGEGRFTDERFINGEWKVFESGTLKIAGAPRTAQR